MPVYCEKITIPANTPEDSPVTKDILIEEKFIDRIEVGFPKNCNYMVGVRINYGIKMWWPTTEGTWIWGNNEIISFEERFEMPSIYETLTITGISPGTYYDHDIIVRIMTLPAGFYFLETLLQKLHDLWEKII
jgi:hypothetical protein